ncbi:MAG: LytTR family transcriptional regulator [Gemmatirosa sp.]|nr:LytTR family transcriptional regulator [Gemmatirosa sp.]
MRDAARVRFVPVASIDWIEGAGYYARLHAAGTSHLLREALTSLAARLDARRFCRIHRSAIVNLRRVQEIRTTTAGDGVVVLHDGTRLRLARGKRAELERLLEALP